MKTFLISLTLLLFSFSSNGQLGKGTWLVGGTGKFYSFNSTNSSATYNIESKFTQIDLSPAVGYFVADK